MRTLKGYNHRINNHAVIGITADGRPRCEEALDFPRVDLLSFYKDKAKHLKDFKATLGEDVDLKSVKFGKPTPGQYNVGMMISARYTLKDFDQKDVDAIIKEEDRLLDRERRISEIEDQIKVLKDEIWKILQEK